MLLKMIRDEDYSSYKEVAMMVAFPTCSFKCCVDAKRSTLMCQNAPVARLPTIQVAETDIYHRYRRNVITHAVVCGGLEPFDTFSDLWTLIDTFRSRGCADLFVVYTGYTEDETTWQTRQLSEFQNIVVKYGRYIPGQTSHFDPILGVMLASPNQFAKKIS